MALHGLLQNTDMQGAGGIRPPLVLKPSVAELSKKKNNKKTTVDCFRGVPTRDRKFVLFYLRSIFGPVMRGRRLDFSEIGKLSALQAYISITINRSDIKLSPARSGTGSFLIRWRVATVF